MSTATKIPVTEDISIGGIDEGIDLNGKAILQPNMSEEELEKQKRQEDYREELSKVGSSYKNFKFIKLHT